MIVNNIIGRMQKEENPLYIFDRENDLITIREYYFFSDTNKVLNYYEFKSFTVEEFYNLPKPKDSSWIELPDDFPFVSTEFRDQRVVNNKTFNINDGVELLSKVIEKHIYVITTNDNIIDSVRHFIESNKIKGYYISF